MKLNHTLVIVITVLLCLTGYALRVPAAETPPARVAIFPFEIHADKDLTFLKDGIQAMLTSRLTSDKSVVLGREETLAALAGLSGPLTEATAREIGQGLTADRVLFGSLTVLGESVSIDAKLVDVTGDTPALAFFTQTQGMGEVIPQINAFAQEINQNVFDRQITPPVASAPAAGAQTPVAGNVPPTDIHAHPEKLMQHPGLYGGTQGGYGYGGAWQQGQEGSTPNPSFTQAQNNMLSATYWRSRNFDRRIDSLAMGDVDNDGRTELVLVEEHVVHLYRFEAGRLIKLKELLREDKLFFVGVDVGDINANGTPEIYLSTLTTFQNGIASKVLEFDGAAFQTLVEDSRYLFRVSRTQGIETLLGQRYRGESPFYAPIHIMQWEGRDLAAGKKVVDVNNANVLGAAMGDLFNRDREITAAYSRGDAIRIFSTPKEHTYSADDEYGGTMTIFTLTRTDQNSIHEFLYLPARIIIDDVDGDGKNELITTRNHDAARRTLRDTRIFKKGQMVSLNWDGLSLRDVWATPKLEKYMSDFAVGDLDDDGNPDLVGVAVPKAGRAMFTQSVSYLIAYPLAQAQPQAETTE